EGWWYEGAGIYRHVPLIKADPLHLVEGSLFVRPERDIAGQWKTHVEVTVRNASREPIRGNLEFEILDPLDYQVAGHWFPLDLPGGQSQRFTAAMEFQATESLPQLWSVDEPNLYRFGAYLCGEFAVEILYGYRSIRFDPDRGFFLNDRPLKLLGACMHQDHA